MAAEPLRPICRVERCIRCCILVSACFLNERSCTKKTYLSASTSLRSSTYPAATSSFLSLPMLAANVCAASSLVSDCVATSSLRSMLACSFWKPSAFFRMAAAWLSVSSSACAWSRRASSSYASLVTCVISPGAQRMLVTCLFSKSCCSLTFSIKESRASKSDEVASRSSM